MFGAASSALRVGGARRLVLIGVALVSIAAATAAALLLVGSDDQSSGEVVPAGNATPRLPAGDATGVEVTGGAPRQPSTLDWSRSLEDGSDAGGASSDRAGRMNSVSAGGPGLVAVGEEGFDAAVWVSEDGAAWSRVPPEDALLGGADDPWERMMSVTRFGTGLVAVGFAEDAATGLGAAVWTSADGVRWARVLDDEAALGGPGGQTMLSVTAGGPGLVAVGWDQPLGRDAAVWTSADGVSWSRVEHDDAVFGGLGYQSMSAVIAGGPGLVAVGRDRTGPVVWTSPDGAEWTRITPETAADIFGPGTGLSGRMNSVTAVGPGLVAVGTSGSDAAAWASEDGITWVRAPYDEAVFGGEGLQEMRSVVPGGLGVVAVGADGANAAVWTSVDGGTWARTTRDAASAIDALSMESVTAGEVGLVAVGAERSLGSFSIAAWTSP
ncbi:MAG: hypothetical protein ACR2OD_07625 [Gaiellaceae bacterium]